MNDDELRSRLARLDPADDASTEPITSTSAQTLLEDIMSTDLHETSTPATDPTPPPSRSKWLAIVGTAAAVVAVAAVGLTVGGAFDGDDEIADDPVVTATPVTTPEEPAVLELSTGESDPMMMSCLAMTPEIIAEAEVAFRATATTVEGPIVTLTVDQWYTGGDEGVVTVTAPEGLEALIGGIDFQVGQPYLVAATDGVVNYCGMSGPATPELQQLYDQAFPA